MRAGPQVSTIDTNDKMVGKPDHFFTDPTLRMTQPLPCCLAPTCPPSRLHERHCREGLCWLLHVEEMCLTAGKWATEDIGPGAGTREGAGRNRPAFRGLEELRKAMGKGEGTRTWCLTAGSDRNALLTMRPFLKRAVLVISYVTVILYFRLWIMGGSMPLFSEQDNPASFSPYFLTRFLTYSYLLAFNVWLLLAPITLCYDWQVGSIPLVETIWDVRNLATVLLALAMASLGLHCLAAFKSNKSHHGSNLGQIFLFWFTASSPSTLEDFQRHIGINAWWGQPGRASSSGAERRLRLEHREVLVGLLFLVLPFLPASNLFFRVGFVVAERVLYMPSMGSCILFVHGLSKLWAWLNRCGATVLTAATVLLLLLFSWKTVKQNEIWLSRESLFRRTLSFMEFTNPGQLGVDNCGGHSTNGVIELSGVETLPHNAKVHYNYANFLKDQGRNREAVYHYRTALKLYPRHASALNNLGTLTRDTAEAQSYYRRALQLNPQHHRALFNLGNLLKEASFNGLGAKRQCRPERRPAAGTSVLCGVVDDEARGLSQEKKEEAVALLRDAIKYGPEFADAYSSLASLLAEQERFQEAEEVYLAGIKNCPDSSDLHNNYGVFLVDTGSPEKAVAHYQQAIQHSPSHHVAMANLGRLYRSLGDNSAAEEWHKRALQVARRAEILSPLGALYYNTGRYEEALHIYREAVALQPSQRELRLALAQVLAVMGQTQEAEKITQQMVSEDSQCLECYRLLSAVHSQREQHGQSYRAAVELNPDQAQAWMNMGGIRHIQGNYVSARAYYERALQLVPDSKLLRENLAKLDRLEKRFQEVQEKEQT
ncbi:Protein O-mannosyl-transferase TMTC1 [Galemys pyrenaicus]|uniref:dolichyl-phosphate-mannose--protein mannosyltransferase n=1 Tax=Galemys pyrenaicus TaxID=202257 RepID=A0A8J6A405_GALPY|nr:Protein O-mannosyl-transferase TMTC1 [Galemys pyrenaicus]